MPKLLLSAASCWPSTTARSRRGNRFRATPGLPCQRNVAVDNSNTRVSDPLYHDPTSAPEWRLTWAAGRSPWGYGAGLGVSKELFTRFALSKKTFARSSLAFANRLSR